MMSSVVRDREKRRHSLFFPTVTGHQIFEGFGVGGSPRLFFLVEQGLPNRSRMALQKRAESRNEIEFMVVELELIRVR
jgi:hypothetical protein